MSIESTEKPKAREWWIYLSPVDIPYVYDHRRTTLSRTEIHVREVLDGDNDPHDTYGLLKIQLDEISCQLADAKLEAVGYRAALDLARIQMEASADSFDAGCMIIRTALGLDKK